MPTPREILAQNRRDAIDYVSRAGLGKTRKLLESAEGELVRRLSSMQGAAMTFTRAQLEAALLQVRDVIGGVNLGMRDVLLDGAGSAASLATRGAIDYLGRLDKQFRGVGVRPIGLDEASMFETATTGARASILRRLASSGTGAPGAPVQEHPDRPGILARYGMNVISHFEEQMRVGIIARSSWEEVKGKLLGVSPFLRGQPASWAERIVRTEMMGAYNRGGWEANREANEQLGDMIKVLSATFDDRTASDSYAYHGMIRRPDEAFEAWGGHLYQHPPNRPNDREIVVPHRMSWPLPPYLVQKKDAEVVARWTAEKRKGSPPPRPKMSTVPIADIGRVKPPKTSERRPPRERIPPEEG